MAKIFNVQQQNALTLNELVSHAKHYRETGLPKPIIEFLASKGIDFKKSIVLQYTDGWIYQEPNGMSILLLTDNQSFYDFEVILDESLTKLIEVSMWQDVSSTQNMSLNNQGFGKGWGAIALEALSILNNS